MSTIEGNLYLSGGGELRKDEFVKFTVDPKIKDELLDLSNILLRIIAASRTKNPKSNPTPDPIQDLRRIRNQAEISEMNEMTFNFTPAMMDVANRLLIGTNQLMQEILPPTLHDSINPKRIALLEQFNNEYMGQGGVPSPIYEEYKEQNSLSVSTGS